MKIALFGHICSELDEGMRKATFEIYNYLKKTDDVRLYNIENPLAWKLSLNEYDPDVVHIIIGPSSTNLLFGINILIRTMTPNKKIVLSALQPGIINPSFIPKFYRPDVALVQSYKTEEFFKSCSYFTKFVPNGVNTRTFQPVERSKRNQIRRKYLLEDDDFILLHVGHITSGRNLEVLCDLNIDVNFKMIVVGSPRYSQDTNVLNELDRAGIKIYTEYIENIYELYQLADVYIFPTLNPRNAIEIPLSVLEALSCNLQLITTPFGGLPRLLKMDEGIFFFENKIQLEMCIKRAYYSRNQSFNTRNQVLCLDWQNIAKMLKSVYMDLINH